MATNVNTKRTKDPILFFSLRYIIHRSFTQAFHNLFVSTFPHETSSSIKEIIHPYFPLKLRSYVQYETLNRVSDSSYRIDNYVMQMFNTVRIMLIHCSINRVLIIYTRGVSNSIFKKNNRIQSTPHQPVTGVPRRTSPTYRSCTLS